MDNLKYFMNLAIKEAQNAFLKNEIPIGCIIIRNNEIISKAHNQTTKKNNILNHAEILAIQKAQKNFNSQILENCVMFITAEPCIMCSGAILLSRISTVVYGCYEPKFGAAGSLLNLLENNPYNRKIKVISGILEDECKLLLKKFFEMKR